MTRVSLFALLFAALTAFTAHAEDGYVLTIKDHKFSPTVLDVPANQKITLTVKNLDNSAEEFESADLSREKVVAANSQITLVLNPLPAGKYHFFGDFHRDTANGDLIAK